MGKLGYKPWELHRITFREAILSIDGINEQNKYLYDLTEISTRLICLSGFNAKAGIQACNKIFRRKRSAGKISEEAKEVLKKLKEKEGFEQAKKVIDGRIQNKG